MNQAVTRVLASLDEQREELAELVLRLANTYAPVGQETAVAEQIDAWYRASGLRSELVEMVEGRANVVASLPGEGAGPSLLFNAHMDTEASGPDYDNLMQVPDPNLVGAWREDDRIFGHTAMNDRHAHALFMLSTRAIKEAGIVLPGNLVLTSVVGETGQAPVDEYRGLRYEGKGFGSSYLVEHGVRADYALVSETTDFAPCWYHCGANYYKVTLRGQNMYTPRLKRGATVGESPNAIVKAARVVEKIEEWAVEYTRSHTGPTPCGVVAPNAQVGAVRGGIPWRPNRSAPYCALYVDVRTRPEDDPVEVHRSFHAAVESAKVDAEVDLIMSKTGALGTGIEPLVDSARTAYRSVRGEEAPAQAEQAVVSMWRDDNVFNKAGIPAIDFGPSRGRADVQGRGYLDVSSLIDAAKMYAIVSLLVTGAITKDDLR